MPEVVLETYRRIERGQVIHHFILTGSEIWKAKRASLNLNSEGAERQARRYRGFYFSYLLGNNCED